MESIDPRELFVRLGDDEVLVVDCRESDDWIRFELQIPGALAMSVSEMTESAHVLPDDELIVLCGTAPDGSDARRAARLLGIRGRDAVILEGGLRAWVASGYPTERSAPRRQSREPADAESYGLLSS